MLSNLSNNNAGNQTKSVVERKHYEDIEDRINELQDEIDSNTESINQNAQDISGLDERIDAVEDNSTFPELNTDTINPATGNGVDVTGNVDVEGTVTADFANFSELSVNGTNFTTVKDNASQAKSTAETAKNKADEAYDLADAVADELADYKADNEQSITTGTLNADSVVADSIAAQTINTNDFETTNAEIDKLYVDTIKATGFLELPTSGQQYYTITIPAKTTASFSGVYTSDNNTDYPFYFTVSDGAVIYKQGSTEIIKDISFDRETGYTKVRVKSSTNLTYISSALDSNPVTIEDGGEAYVDYAFLPQKTGGYLIRGYDDTTTEVYIAGVLKAYAMSIEEEIIERTSVDFLKVNASIELPADWDAGGTISYSTGEENQYISAQTKAGVTKPTWTSPIHSTIGSLSYSSKLVDEATIASYKGISETRQTQTITITDEASLQQLTAFHWTKNGTYWQPYEITRITIGDNTMWIDPTEANQGIRFYDNQVIADGTWDDVPVEEANAVPVNLVIFDAPSELSFPITNLGDKTTVHGEITATCFKGNVLGNVTGNADTATNATHFDNKTYAEACADILSGKAAQAALADLATNATCFDGKTYSQACADILSGNAATATNANNADNFDGKDYATVKADILSGNAASATNATCFDGHTYADAKADILSGNAASATNATNATCFDGCTYAQAKADIRNYTPSYATCTSCPIIHATDDTTATQHKIPFAKYTGSTNDETPLNCDDCFYYTTVSQRLNTKNLCVSCCAEIDSAHILSLKTYNVIDGKASEACCSNCAQTVYTGGSANTQKLLSSTCGWSTPNQTGIDYDLSSNTLSNANIDISGCSLKAATGCFTGNVEIDCNVNIGGDLNVAGTITTTHSEEVVTPSENILLRDGATTAIPSGHYSGFTITNYDGQNNDLEVGADKDGTLHIGTTNGVMEPVATRACEACMENGYAAHWDSTGTDLVTKGATSTHDLCINGDASVTGTITGTFSGNLTGDVTGNVTGDVTGNADSATNAACFNGKTYSEAKTDILSGNAASATNATCFDGCTYACAKADILSGCAADSSKFAGRTYACAKADILSGNAASAAYATQVVPFCDATDEEKNLAFFDSDVDCGNPDTIQYDAGKNLTFNPVSNNLTVAGDVKAKNAVRRGEYYNISQANVNKYVLLAQASYAYNGNRDVGISGYVTSGNSFSNRFTLVARVSKTAVQQYSSLLLLQKTDDIKGTYDFDATSHTLTIRLYGKLTGLYQRTKIAIDTFTKGDVYPFVSTYDSALTLPMTVSATMTGTEITTTYVKVESSTSADNSTCFNGCTYAQACSDIRSGLISDIGIDVNCDATCVCTLNNGSTLALSANAFNENATISTDTYPGACCTGTSNYVVTTMVCCAKGVCRNQATTGTCHLALFSDKTAVANADAYVSNACELTYEPATGTLNTKRIYACCDSYHAQLITPNGSTRYITLKLSNANGWAEFTSNVDIYVYDNHIHANVKVSTGIVSVNEISRTNDYAITQYLLGEYDSTDDTITIYFRFSGYREANIVSSTPIVEASASTTAPTGTFTAIPLANRTSYVCTSSTNTEYPLVFSTCCATPAAGNRTLYNDSANNLMYNPSTNTLTTTYVSASTRLAAGNPTACTSTQAGSSGSIVGSGAVELFGTTPFIDFHHNNACDDFSHRLIANNGYLRVTATNATGCTAATQTANFDFCSDGTFAAAGDIQAKNAVRRGEYYNVASGNVNKYVLLAQASYAYNGNHDLTISGYITGAGSSIANNLLLNRFTLAIRGTASSVGGYVFRMLYSDSGEYKATYELDATTHNLTVRIYAKVIGQYQRIKIAIDNFTKGDVYPFASTYDSALTLPMTLSATTTGTEIDTSYVTVNNSTCFGGCTYAQACADIAGSVETTEFTCINDVNSGAQDILMTSSTGTLGIVNASTGTNACPLTFNPSTGVLSSKCVATDIVKIGELSCITCGANVGNTMIGRMYISNDGFTIGAEHPTCHSSDYNWYYAVACGTTTSLGKSARATVGSVAIGSVACACCPGSVAVGCNACAMLSCTIAIGYNAQARANDTVAIGHGACTYLAGVTVDCHVVYSCGASAHFRWGSLHSQDNVFQILACQDKKYSPMWPIGCGCTYCGRHMVPARWIWRNGTISDAGNWLSWDGDRNIDLTGTVVGSDHAIHEGCFEAIGARLEIWADWSFYNYCSGQ